MTNIRHRPRDSLHLTNPFGNGQGQEKQDPLRQMTKRLGGAVQSLTKKSESNNIKFHKSLHVETGKLEGSNMWMYKTGTQSYTVSTTPQGHLQQGTELYSDNAKAQNQAGILNRSIIVDTDVRVRSTHNINNNNNILI